MVGTHLNYHRFIKAYVVGTHLDCLNLSAFIKEPDKIIVVLI